MIAGSDVLSMNITMNAHKGLMFPKKMISIMFNGNDLEEIEGKELEAQMLFFVQRNQSVQVSDVADFFKVHPSKAMGIIENLERQEKIKLVN